MNIKKRLFGKVWNIGFIESVPLKDVISKPLNIHLMKHKEKKWFADPFILNVTKDEIVVLVEEMDFCRKKGRLARLTVDRSDYTLKEVRILLELDTHLSFPAIIRNGDEVYVYPENSESGRLTKYKYDYCKDQLIEVGTIIDEPLTDAVCFYINNEEYILSTKQPNPNGNELNIFKKESNTYHLHQQVLFSDNTARNAGDLFYDGDILVRPAQNCNGYYGVGIAFQKVEVNDGYFRFNEIGRIGVPSGYNGFHTFNKFEDLIAIDVRKANHPFIHKNLLRIKKIIS